MNALSLKEARVVAAVDAEEFEEEKGLKNPDLLVS